MRVSIKMQKNELRVNFYTRVLNTKLNGKLDNAGGDYAVGHYIFQSTSGIAANAWTNAPILVEGTDTPGGSRAQIGFNNTESNAGILWLDTDGSLNFTDNQNRTKKINWTEWD